MIAAATIRQSLRRSAAVGLLAVLACGRKAADAGGPDSAQAVVTAETAGVTVEPFTEIIGAIASVEARPGHFARLSAPAPARIARVLVSAGQRVTRNQPLIEFERAAFIASAQGASAAVTAAQLARDRAQRLVQQGVAARKDLEQAEADLAKAKADEIAAQRVADLAIMRSPIDGVVTRMDATLGASADPAQTLVEIADPSALDVMLSVQPAAAARIRVGNRVSLRASQRATDSLGAGEVADIAGVVDSASRTVEVRVRVTTSQRALRIGETLFGEIAMSVHLRAVTVPLAALVPEGDGFKVFVVDSSAVVHARAVSIGGRTDRVAEIVKGLTAGERVVTEGAFGVEDGSRIVAPVAARTHPDSTSPR